MNLPQLSALDLIFYTLSLIAVVSAFAVITAKHPVRSVLSLVVTFFAMAGVWMILRAEFLSLILLLVYVGAVMTLFLFVVMMLHVEAEQKRSGFVSFFPLGILVLLIMIGSLFMVIGPDKFGLTILPAPEFSLLEHNNTQQLGELLYTDFVYPFEVAGVILLVAMIAAISLAFRGIKNRKVQSPAMQSAAQPKDYVRLVNLSTRPSAGEDNARSE